MFKIKKLLSALLFTLLYALYAAPAMAEDFGPVQPSSAKGLAQTIYNLVAELGMPIGGSIIFGCVVIASIKIATAGLQGRAEKKAEAIGGFGYVVLAGILLGASLFVAGALIGIGQQVK
ncbi:hypothetical protein [Desulfofundulus thermocisternus]|uniref:hypothetical protein n=1 Tax=Desulfofundulus thermocisternus TaxID=42471 RepID=UPI00217D3C91|nr:hypothetical protein [Desulfofundulus thermocisternus]MCS5696924.1 hypothetical protein [Desulfofundulus thermocisternus]